MSKTFVKTSGAGKLSLIMPCFNEGKTIEHTVASIISYMRDSFPSWNWELILVDDGSQDDTAQLLRLLQSTHDLVKVITFKVNRGRGAAIKAGLGAATGNWLITLDADLSYDVDHIAQVLQVFEKDPTVDVVVVSPYMKGGTVRGVPYSRLLLSRAANAILAGFFAGRLSTVTCMVRGYKSSILKGVPLFENGKELHLEILRKLALCGARIVEIPGRLIWLEKKDRSRRLDKRRLIGAASRHIQYATMIRPTRVIKYISFALIFAGLYETGAAMVSAAGFFVYSNEGLLRSLWLAMSKAYEHSPHTFFIGGVSLILGIQSVTFLALFHFMKLQQEESLRHILAMMSGNGRRQESG